MAKTDWVPEVKIPDPKVPTEAEIAAKAAQYAQERDSRQADEDRARATHDLMWELNRDRDVAFALDAAVKAGWSVPAVVWPDLGAAPLGNRGNGDVVGFGAGSQWALRRTVCTSRSRAVRTRCVARCGRSVCRSAPRCAGRWR